MVPKPQTWGCILHLLDNLPPPCRCCAPALLRVGAVLCCRAAAEATCRLLYRAVLRLLPASARTWFGDLRDRSMAAAVEAYTAAAESPALIAAELASIQQVGGGAVALRGVAALLS